MKRIIRKTFLTILGLIVLSDLSFYVRAQSSKTKVKTITEDLYISRECPDDPNGEHNGWSVSVDGIHITATCSYLVEDDGQ